MPEPGINKIFSRNGNFLTAVFIPTRVLFNIILTVRRLGISNNQSRFINIQLPIVIIQPHK